MGQETWKSIPDYENYQVSNLGNVKNLNFNNEKRESHLKYRLNKGYKIVSLCRLGKQKIFKIHQLVAMAFLGHKPCGMKIVVNHINLIRTDNHVENLELITNRENCNKKHLKSTSQYTGVCFRKRNNKWSSQIDINKKQVFLGYFENEIDAHIAYQNKLKEITK